MDGTQDVGNSSTRNREGIPATNQRPWGAGVADIGPGSARVGLSSCQNTPYKVLAFAVNRDATWKGGVQDNRISGLW